MAKITLNSNLQSVSGLADGWVYRRVNSQTIAAGRPKPATSKPTAAQLAQRDRFVRAAEYATETLGDPCQRRVYQALAKERNRRADKLLTSDYLTPPVVEHIEVSGYRGQPGGLIRVIATDDIEVVAVHVAIQTGAGAVVEQGAAGKIHGVWVYRATTVAPDGEALKITGTAKDRPGHVGEATVSYP